MGDCDQSFKHCLVKFSNKLLNNYDIRKQKAYMRAGLLKPSSRRHVQQNQDIEQSPKQISLTRQQIFSQGELIEIFLSIILSFWIKSMTASGRGPRGKATKSSLITQRNWRCLSQKNLKRDKAKSYNSKKDAIPRKTQTKVVKFDKKPRLQEATHVISVGC